jgi:general secretion pathway protein E
MADGLILKDEAKAKYNEAQGILKNGPSTMHPLTATAQCKLLSAKTPHAQLTLDWLTEWAAAKVHLPFYRIDPLKIDFTTVSDVMSSTYATRFNILPVESNANTVVVATTDPYNTEWQDEIARISRKEIRLVLANPLEISQYIVQFFRWRNRLKMRVNPAAMTWACDKTSSNWLNLVSRINKSMRMISTSSISLTGYGNLRLISAPRIFISNPSVIWR